MARAKVGLYGKSICVFNPVWPNHGYFSTVVEFALIESSAFFNLILAIPGTKFFGTSWTVHDAKVRDTAHRSDDVSGGLFTADYPRCWTTNEAIT